MIHSDNKQFSNWVEAVFATDKAKKLMHSTTGKIILCDTRLAAVYAGDDAHLAYEATVVVKFANRKLNEFVIELSYFKVGEGNKGQWLARKIGHGLEPLAKLLVDEANATGLPVSISSTATAVPYDPFDL